MRTTYFVFDRLFFLMNSKKVKMKNYCEKYEVSRSTFFRDIEHLSLFYNITFNYDAERNEYIRG